MEELGVCVGVNSSLLDTESVAAVSIVVTRGYKVGGLGLVFRMFLTVIGGGGVGQLDGGWWWWLCGFGFHRGGFHLG